MTKCYRCLEENLDNHLCAGKYDKCKQCQIESVIKSVSVNDDWLLINCPVCGHSNSYDIHKLWNKANEVKE